MEPPSLLPESQKEEVVSALGFDRCGLPSDLRHRPPGWILEDGFVLCCHGAEGDHGAIPALLE